MLTRDLFAVANLLVTYQICWKKADALLLRP